MPPKLKTVSVSTAPASRPPVCRPIVVMTGQQGVAHDVAGPDDLGGQALGLGGAHVVLVEHVEHGGAGDPEDHRERDRGERDRQGSTRWRRASAEQSNSRVSRPSSTKKPVTRVQPSAESWRPDTGKIGVSTANQYLSRKARKKTGTATPMSDSDDGAVVERRAASLRGEVAQRDREDDGDDHRADAQLDRRGQPGRGRCRRRHGPGSTAVEAPNSPAGGPLQELEVLHVHRLVEAEAPRSSGRASSGVARSPRIAETTPPGSERSQKKSSRERTNTTPTIWIRRRMMNLANVGLLWSPEDVGGRLGP